MPEAWTLREGLQDSAKPAGCTGSPDCSCGTGHGQAPKWWHVPDERIEEIIRDMAQPAAPAGEGKAGRRKLRAVPRPRPAAAAQGTPAPQPAQQERHGPPAAPERRRTVRFEGAQPDALEELLRRSFGGGAGGASSSSARPPSQEVVWEYDDNGVLKPRKWWKVTDAELRRKIEEAAAELERTGNGAAGSGRPWCPGAAAAADEHMAVNIFIVESSDTLTLRVSPDLRLGPPAPPKKNIFTEVFGLGASTKGFDKATKSFDYRRREFGSTQRPEWSPQWSNSFKGLIAKVINVVPERQRLYFKNVPISTDETTLRSYGIAEGDTLQLRLVRLPRASSQVSHEVTLACTRRKEEVRERLREQDTASSAAGCPSLRHSAMLKHCKSDGDVWMMPRWISQSNPNLFAPVGVGLDGEGGFRVCQEFGCSPIYVPDSVELSRVRESLGIIKPR